MTGSASLDMYDPQEIVKLGKVVFVSIQYRLGAHGFLYFGEDSSAPGNVGLLDQVFKFIFVYSINNIRKTQNEHLVRASTYLLLPLGKWGSKKGDFHWAVGCV